MKLNTILLEMTDIAFVRSKYPRAYSKTMTTNGGQKYVLIYLSKRSHMYSMSGETAPEAWRKMADKIRSLEPPPDMEKV